MPRLEEMFGLPDGNYGPTNTKEANMSSYTMSAMSFYDKVTDLIDSQSRWSQSTFGTDAERGPMGALRHLEKEAKEAQEAIGTDDLIEEMADCFLLLLDANRRAGFKFSRLVDAAQAKMEINKLRTWPKPVGDNPVDHVK